MWCNESKLITVKTFQYRVRYSVFVKRIDEQIMIAGFNGKHLKLHNFAGNN